MPSWCGQGKLHYLLHYRYPNTTQAMKTQANNLTLEQERAPHL